GGVVELRGRARGALVVAEKNPHGRAGHRAGAQRRGRLAPGCPDLLLAPPLKPGQVINPGTADDAKHSFGHAARSVMARHSASKTRVNALVSGHPRLWSLRNKSWMPGSADRFTQCAQAGLRCRALRATLADMRSAHVA